MSEVSFVERAEAALRTGQSASDVRVIAAQAPPLLDALGRRALTAPLLAGFLWAAVVFRATVDHAADQASRAGLDPIGLIFRLLALALTVRTILLCVQLWPRLMAFRNKSRYALALTDDGLLLRTPLADFPVAKDDIIDIQEHGAWGDHSGRRWAHVYVITRPDSGRYYLALPPLFEATPGVLAERLMRWRGARPQPREDFEENAPEPNDLPSKLFDRAAAGESLPGAVVIRHGSAYLRRGPYATVLLGVAVLTDWVALPAEARMTGGMLAPLVIGFSLLAVPAIWLVMMKRDLKPRKGLALVLTPAEMLMRTRAGVHRVSWKEVQKLEITSRTAWSVLLGPHPQRTLVIRRKPSPAAPDEDNTITYVEEFLGAPAEVVVALGDGYRKGILP